MPLCLRGWQLLFIAAAAAWGEHTGLGRRGAPPSLHQGHARIRIPGATAKPGLSGIGIMKKGSSSRRAGPTPRASPSSLGVVALLLRAALGGPLLSVLPVIRKWKPKPRTEHGGRAGSRLSEPPGQQGPDFF